MADRPHHHDHDHVHMDEAHWKEWAAFTELQGEVLLAYVTDTAAWIKDLRGPDAPPVRRVLDIGSGPGVGTCELARCFPDAQVVAVDSSPAMLDLTAQRAATHHLQDRIGTHLAALPDGLDEVEPAEVIWASMSLHHVGDEVAALRRLRDLLEPEGLLALAEWGEPMRVLPADVGIGRPGLAERMASAFTGWFAEMREGLPGSVPSSDLPSMVAAAGLEVVASRLASQCYDPPLGDNERQLALGHLRHARAQLGERLDEEDRRTLDVLADVDDPRSAVHRPDLFVASSRQIIIARPPPTS